jgi:3-oxoacyl-[acyl-carrier protein] reductase
MDFRERVVIVTGAGAGIGRAIATAFVKAGARVMANDLVRENIDETAVLLRPIAADRIATHVADVRVKSEIGAMVTETTRRLGPIDILVNNAGICPSSPVIEMPVEEWDTVMATNLRGPFLLCQVVARQMIERGKGGKIINITSGAYKSARRGAAHYCASKSGLDMFTKVLALELGEHHINVNAVAPGLTDTGAVAETPEQYRDTLVKAIPWGRMARPEEIARAVLFLASEESEYITGETLSVDGGSLVGRYFLPPSGKGKAP